MWQLPVRLRYDNHFFAVIDDSIRDLENSLMLSLILLAGTLQYDVANFDREAWHSDYARLKEGMAQGYANLDWIVRERGLDLVALDQKTSARLDNAISDIDAYLAIEEFVSAFRDPHLILRLGNAPGHVTMLPIESSVEPGAICNQAGYVVDNDLATDLAYTAHPDWKPFENQNFPAGMIGDTAILRIARFTENSYAEACKSVEEADLDERELQLATRAKLNSEIELLIQEIHEAGATRLVIDVTNNGGGSEWINDVAAMFSDKQLLRPAPLMTGPECDRASIWEGLETCAILQANDEKDTVNGRGLWTGPLALLMDRYSASATEGFAVFLGEYDRAVLIGEKTYGAGCGYIDGGYAFQFEVTPLYIRMPNCARFTAEGINEIEGIKPAISTRLSRLSAEEFPPLFDSAFATP